MLQNIVLPRWVIITVIYFFAEHLPWKGWPLQSCLCKRDRWEDGNVIGFKSNETAVFHKKRQKFSFFFLWKTAVSYYTVFMIFNITWFVYSLSFYFVMKKDSCWKLKKKQMSIYAYTYRVSWKIAKNVIGFVVLTPGIWCGSYEEQCRRKSTNLAIGCRLRKVVQVVVTVRRRNWAVDDRERVMFCSVLERRDQPASHLAPINSSAN